MFIYMMRFVTPKGSQQKTFCVADSAEEGRKIITQRLSEYGEGLFGILPGITQFTLEDVVYYTPVGRSLREVLPPEDVAKIAAYLEKEQKAKAPITTDAPESKNLKEFRQHKKALQIAERLPMDQDAHNRTSQSGISRYSQGQ